MKDFETIRNILSELQVINMSINVATKGIEIVQQHKIACIKVFNYDEANDLDQDITDYQITIKRLRRRFNQLKRTL